MKFIIGGYAQGKTEYALNNYAITANDYCDDVLSAYIKNIEKKLDMDISKKKVCIKNLNAVAYDFFKEGKDMISALEDFIKNYPECVIISTEIGNGIVPVDKTEREYREWMGRVQTYVASKANEVVRVVCGIGQKIK